MTWPVVLAVLCGALLHASWNALIKSGDDKAVDTALVHFLAALLALPLLFWVGLPQPGAWPFIATSLLIHIGYYIALVGAYRHGDLGLTYPIMRGCAPLLVALASTTFLDEAPSAIAWLGIVGITRGCRAGRSCAPRRDAAPPQGARVRVRECRDHRALHHRRRHRRALGRQRAALRDAAVRARRHLVPARRLAAPQCARRAARSCATRAGRWPAAMLGGGASIGSYTIALWAMTRAPVASVAALRETSVLFAALLGTLLLKERFGVQRAVGTGVIVGGVMALRFG